MMLSGQENFADIALACGFSDQSHMTRLFTRLVGGPPNSWRRNRVYA
ncbi:helix-turn-helix domain-containing protein [Phyllobacterium endophyticum]|nr:helix-turn-helix transcriptional regulator [Phyllobacterium endophyticum]